MPSLLYFIFKRVVTLPFHGNLKFLLISYFGGTFCFATITCVNFGYHFFLPFFVSSKCSLIIPRVLFEHGHLTSLVCMTIPMILPVGFTIERFVALIMARSYENVRTFLGPLLVLVLTVIDCSILYAIYHDDPFTDNFINFILIPSNSAQKFNMFFWALVVIKVTNFLCNSILLFIHKRMEKITIKHSSTLSTKYNMEEISQSSRFTLTVTFAHLLFFGWYVGSILFIRTVGPDFFGGTVNYSIMRGVYCATPTYNLVIVFIGIKAIRRLNVQRKNRISSTVQVKSTGDEGAKNYDNAISNYWDTVYTEKKNVKY
ncbi:Protein CBR-SRB-12 [Caenorhabditis briggsae]|uniref:Protein CBR-SRB-12 n=1 Tax=Caenorhabditis briggsae TaxID=6238 RepID=A8WUK1_CAEBR|nr:Protein CBR-SRB-12 [Caenorhabditis briggsae]CAP24163.2 Protein CBR-SRB-12 [Caenorhabditis briggsae]